MNKIAIVILIFIFSLVIRFYQFDSLPAEWFGDISNVHEYVEQILGGEWPFYFFQSPGPSYHYLITPIVIVFHNQGYETYKIASILVSMLGLFSTFLMARQFLPFSFAAITVFLMSASFWFVIWSRLGNSQIVIPVLSSLLGFFIIRIFKSGKLRDFVGAAIISSAGWYTYPHTFILPLIVLFFLVVKVFIAKKKASAFIYSIITIALLILFMLPFLGIVAKQPDNFGRGYIGQKVLPVGNMSIGQISNKLWNNAVKTALMFHIKGDEIFRINVSGHPQLDRISGLLMLAGFIYFVVKKKIAALAFIITMMIFLSLPSLSPAIPEGEIPNSGRTIALIPYVSLLVAAGLLLMQSLITRVSKSHQIAKVFLPLLLAAVVYFNLRLYFIDYAWGLPDHNLAPGKLIAQVVDRYPANVSLYYGSCCWGEWGEPENKGVMYVLRKPRNFVDHHHIIQSCDEVKEKPALVLLEASNEQLVRQFRACGKNADIIVVSKNDNSEIAKLILIQ